MDNNTSNKENRSMYLYTALIFVVALVLIILAFFGQKNISDSQKKIDTAVESITTEPSPSETVAETPNDANTSDLHNRDDFAKLLNDANTLSEKNQELSLKITTYDLLLSANTAVYNNDLEKAKTIIAEINIDLLTEDQKILYNQITETINK